MNKFVVVVHWEDPTKTVAQYMPDVASCTPHKVLRRPHREFFTFDSRTEAETFGKKIGEVVPVQSYKAIDNDGKDGASVLEPAIYICPYGEVFS
jgi:hypothetical protein